MDSRGSYVSKILYVKMKESGPLGGHAPGMPPRSTNVMVCVFYSVAEVLLLFFSYMSWVVKQRILQVGHRVQYLYPCAAATAATDVQLT